MAAPARGRGTVRADAATTPTSVAVRPAARAIPADRAGQGGGGDQPDAYVARDRHRRRLGSGRVQIVVKTGARPLDSLARDQERNEVIELGGRKAARVGGHAATTGRDARGDLVATHARRDVTQVRAAPATRVLDRVTREARLRQEEIGASALRV